MFNSHKNSYLQLVCAVNPRIINKAVDRAMEKKCLDHHTEQPAAQRLESMQPSLYAPHVDITRARLGFGRIGLRIINRDLHSTDQLKQLQALHSILDQVQITENAMFLININVVSRLIDLMFHRDPVIREKVCLALTHLATYHQGRHRIMSRPEIVDNLMKLIIRDRKEIRYAAAYTLSTLSMDRCTCEKLMANQQIVENLLKMIKSDHTGIVILHLKTLENLTEWDRARALKANAFQVTLKLFDDKDPRVVCGAMDCMTELCQHDVGAQLADVNDLTFVLIPYVASAHSEVIISAVTLMGSATLTTRSKWRAKERCVEITEKLVALCHQNSPPLQLVCLQALLNLCDCPDIRHHMKAHWEKKVRGIVVRTHEQWDGTSETTSFGIETGHNYRTMCIEGVETIKNDCGGDALAVDVHSYLRAVAEKKEQLIEAINWKSYRD